MFTVTDFALMLVCSGLGVAVAAVYFYATTFVSGLNNSFEYVEDSIDELDTKMKTNSELVAQILQQTSALVQYFNNIEQQKNGGRPQQPAQSVAQTNPTPATRRPTTAVSKATPPAEEPRVSDDNIDKKDK